MNLILFPHLNKKRSQNFFRGLIIPSLRLQPLARLWTYYEENFRLSFAQNLLIVKGSFGFLTTCPIVFVTSILKLLFRRSHRLRGSEKSSNSEILIPFLLPVIFGMILFSIIFPFLASSLLRLSTVA